MFGWEPLPLKGRGRPSHVRSEEKVNKVMVLLAMDKSNLQIANALGITEPTLRKHYFPELKVRAMARDALEAEVLVALVGEAKAGSVGAFKQVQARFDRIEMALRAKAIAGDEDRKPQQRAIPKGKKDQAKQAAEDVLAENPLFNPLRVN